jgi:hypothetical protein
MSDDIRVRDAKPSYEAAVRDLVAAAGLPLEGLGDVDTLLVAERNATVVGAVALERHAAVASARH